MVNKIEILSEKGKMTDEFNYVGSKDDYIYIDVEKIAEKNNDKIVKEIQTNIKEQIEKKTKEIEKNKEKLREGIFELSYYAYKGAMKYSEIVNDGESDVDLITFIVHSIIEPLIDELYEQRSIDIREIKNKNTHEGEMLIEYLDYLEPLNTEKSKMTHDYYQNKLEQYKLEYIARKLNDGYYHNAKVTNIYGVVDFLKDAKDNNFGINIFTENLYSNEFLVFHAPELDCYDVYNSNLNIDAIVVDKEHLGKVLYILECDNLDDILEDLAEDECQNCYWCHLDTQKQEDLICGCYGEIPSQQYGCKNFEIIERE